MMTTEQAAIRKAVASAIADAQACTDVGDPTRFPCEICERSDGCFTVADAAIAAYLKALEAAGLYVVPVEPTEAMIEVSDREWDMSISYRSTRAWKAMIAARPR